MNPKRRSSEAGFTMVEILTALTIMGLMAGVVVLSLPSADAAFRGEVRQLAARLEMAAQESVVGGHALGFAIDGQGYAFQRVQTGSWVEMANDRMFSPHRWNEATSVAFERSSFFQREADAEEPDGVKLPMLRFDPTGLPARFVIRLERGASRYVVEASGSGVEVSDANL
jgi:type II secretion system protein H